MDDHHFPCMKKQNINEQKNIDPHKNVDHYKSHNNPCKNINKKA